MIYFGINITNPWSKRWENCWNRTYELPIKNKMVEFERFKDNTIVSFTFRLTTRQDHAGLMIELGLLGHSILFNFYDIRHYE